MKAVLKTSSPAMEDATPVLGVRTRSRASRGNSWPGQGVSSQVGHPVEVWSLSQGTDDCAQEVAAKGCQLPRTPSADVFTHFLSLTPL